jgi:hypothetical protein
VRTTTILGFPILALVLHGCGPATLDIIPDDGTLRGWHVSSRTSHGTGGRWVARDGVILGTQDRPGNGGLLITDAQYGDFEIRLDMKNDYGPDSGLFLRCTEDGRAYQAMIDYHPDGNLMGIYGEGIGNFVARNFDTLGSPGEIKIRDYPKFPCPFSPEEWKSRIWRADDWNELRARIVGNPPVIHTWINGVKVMEFTDDRKRLPDRGGIGLQLHGKEDSSGRFVRYRNIRLSVLEERP